MAYRRLRADEVRELLRRYLAGESARAMELARVADRKTVARYLGAARAVGLRPDAELSEELVTRVAAQVQRRERKTPSLVRKALMAREEMIRACLNDRVSLTRIRSLLARDSVVVSYTTLRRVVLRLRSGEPSRGRE